MCSASYRGKLEAGVRGQPGVKYDPAKHHRRSIRLKGYDYTRPGAYFITLVTYHRDCIFGEIIGGQMRLSPLGGLVRAEWLRSIDIRPEIRLLPDEFVIMPNHFHGIVWITDLVRADGVRPIRPENDLRPPDDHPPDAHPFAEASSPEEPGACHAPQRPIRPEDGVPPGRAPHSLASFIAGFKAAVTSRAGRELNLSGIWQRNYYEHIIRSDRELLNIRNYIANNPQQWQADQIHPSAAPNPFNQD